MTSSLRFVFALLLVVTMGALAHGQDVLFDFDDPLGDPDNDPFGHFGAVTLDSGVFADCGTVGNFCATHTGRFTEIATSPHEIGMIEIGPGVPPLVEGAGIDLSAYVGYSIDARFIRDTDGLGGAGEEVFSGLSPLKAGLQWEPTDSCPSSMDACSDLYDAPVELTETFQTLTVMFADLNLPPATDLSDVQIKMLMLTGDFNSAVAPNRKLNSGDFNASSSVDGADFITWQRNFGFFDPGGAARFINGNADIDQDIDAADLTIWEDQYGTDAPIADWSNGVGRLEIDNVVGILPPSDVVHAVPEPSSCCLILCCGYYLLTCGARNSP